MNHRRFVSHGGVVLRRQVNYRFAGMRGCRDDRLDTLNLAYGPVVPGAFLGEHTHHIDERGHLR